MRIRLLFSMLLVVIVTTISMGSFALISTSREVTRYVSRGGMMGLNELVSNLESYYQQFGSWAGAEILIASHMDQNRQSPMGMGGMQQGAGGGGGADRLVLADPSGRILMDTQPEGNRRDLTLLETRQAIELNLRDGTQVGYLYASNLSPIQPAILRPLLLRLNTAGIRAGVIGAGIALLLSLLLGYWFMKPVTKLSQAASALGGGDLTQRVVVRGNDELAQLGKTFNGMAESLQKAETSRKNMTADIAHELRTPLSVQRASVEAMLDGVYPLNAESLVPLLEQNLLLTRLVDDLRLLALADAGELPLEIVETNISGIAERVATQFQTQAAREDVQVKFTSDHSTPSVLVDPIRAEQILTNLIGNALKFTPLAGSIRIHVGSSPDTIEIRVADDGSGIPVESLPYIFDRFYRGDKGRSREQGGSGLGLAIARQLARAQGGEITAQNLPRGGAEFTWSIPLHPSQPN